MGGGSTLPGTRLTPSGLVVAGVGFLLTRFTVTLAATEDTLRFLAGGVVPLTLGLSVAAYGVALTVGEYERGYVRTVALWSVGGTLATGLFLALTLFGAAPGTAMAVFAPGSDTHLSNLLIGGCAGGTVAGVLAARNRRRRLAQSAHAKRMVVLNHVFRDAVLNALTAIRGHVRLLEDDRDAATTERAVGVIDEQTGRLEDSVEEIRHLARGETDPEQGLVPVAVDERVEVAVADARDRFPEAEIRVDGAVPALSVRADALLDRILELLVENAVIHSDATTPTVRVRAERDGDVARIEIADNGPGLPAPQQAMLASGTVEEFDDPSTGFGLNVATLLAESYGGRIDAAVDEDGTTVAVVLPLLADRRNGDAATAPGREAAGAVPGVSQRRLVTAAGASLVAGVLMGVVVTALGGAVPVIGSLYGVADPVVGWVAHTFHSVVFGLVYLVLLRWAPRDLGRTPAGQVGLGIAWGMVLWLVAAGVVMPLWLQLVGVPATVPTLALGSLVGHAVWGATLGAGYALATGGWPAARGEARPAPESS